MLILNVNFDMEAHMKKRFSEEQIIGDIEGR